MLGPGQPEDSIRVSGLYRVVGSQIVEKGARRGKRSVKKNRSPHGGKKVLKPHLISFTIAPEWIESIILLVES